MINPWTEEKTADLRKLWADGESCSRIARKLGAGFTRNAVIGKVTRLKLAKRQTRTRSVSELLRRLEGRKQKRQGGIRKRALKAPKLELVQLAEALEASLAIDLLDLQHGQCRWPTSLNAPHVFCGHPWQGESGPYCPCHMRMAHREEPPKPLDNYADWISKREYRVAA